MRPGTTGLVFNIGMIPEKFQSFLAVEDSGVCSGFSRGIKRLRPQAR